MGKPAGKTYYIAMEHGTPIYVTSLNKKRTLMRILAAAMMFSVILYVVVAWFLSVQPEAAPPTEAGTMLRIPLGVVSICIGLAVIALRTILFSRERLERQLAAPPNLEKAAVNPQTRKVDPALLESLKTMTEAEQKLISLITWYQTPYIVMLALSESIAIFGLVLSIVSKSPFEMLPFAVVSLFLVIRTAMHPAILIDEAESVLQRLHRTF
jgi:hypothetical protein